MKRKLRTYQKEILRYTYKVRHPALFVDMRLGKTLITIRRIQQYTRCNSVLIVCPYSAFRGWKLELYNEWEGYPVDLSRGGETVSQGGPKQPKNVPPVRPTQAHHGPKSSPLIKTRKSGPVGYNPGHFSEKIGPNYPVNNTGEKGFDLLYKQWPVSKWFIINKEGFLRHRELNKFPWDVVVLDESTFIKRPNTKVSQYFVNNFRDVSHRWILTGLPDPESDLDYFQQLQFLDRSILGTKNYYVFRHKYFTIGEFGIDITDKGKQFLNNRLADKCCFLSRKQAGVGTIKVYEQRTIKMPANIKKIYNKMKREFILETDKYFKMTKYAGVKFSWMREICNGIVYKDDDTKEMVWDGKIKLLEELLNGELKGVPLVIWCHYLHDIKYICECFDKKVKLKPIYGNIPVAYRELYVKDFMQGKIQWLIIQPQCMQYGADLSLTSTCIYYSTPIGLETRLQTEDRIIDVEKKEPSLIIDLIVEGTIEEGIHQSLAHKEGRGLLMKNLIRRLQCEK